MNSSVGVLVFLLSVKNFGPNENISRLISEKFSGLVTTSGTNMRFIFVVLKKMSQQL